MFLFLFIPCHDLKIQFRIHVHISRRCNPTCPMDERNRPADVGTKGDGSWIRMQQRFASPTTTPCFDGVKIQWILCHIDQRKYDYLDDTHRLARNDEDMDR